MLSERLSGKAANRKVAFWDEMGAPRVDFGSHFGTKIDPKIDQKVETEIDA